VYIILAHVPRYYVDRHYDINSLSEMASKAFDRVKFCKLFQELFNLNMSPVIIISNLYINQNLQFKWK